MSTAKLFTDRLCEISESSVCWYPWEIGTGPQLGQRGANGVTGVGHCSVSAGGVWQGVGQRGSLVWQTGFKLSCPLLKDLQGGADILQGLLGLPHGWNAATLSSKCCGFTSSPQQTRLNAPNNTDYTDNRLAPPWSHCFRVRGSNTSHWHQITTTEIHSLEQPITFDGILNFCYNEGNLRALEENKKLNRKKAEGGFRLLPPAKRSALSKEGTTSFCSWLWILPPSKGPISVFERANRVVWCQQW